MVAGSLLVGLLVVEVALHILPLPVRDTHFALTTTFRLDPELVYTFRPGSEVTWATDEFTEYRRINSLGMRDREPAPKLPGEMRVLAVGDSFTYGHGVQASEAWPRVLEIQLREHGRDAIVLNAGVPGWSPDQSYRYLERHADALAVDVVLFAINRTDIDDVISTPLYDVADGRLVPLRADQTSIYLQGRIASVLPSPLGRLRTIRLLLSCLRGLDPYDLRPRLETGALRAWARTKIQTEIVSLHRTLQQRDITLVTVLTPQGGELESIVADLRSLSIPVVSIMLTPAGEPDFYFPRDGHLTVAGNAFVGRRIAERLIQEDLLPP